MFCFFLRMNRSSSRGERRAVSLQAPKKPPLLASDPPSSSFPLCLLKPLWE